MESSQELLSSIIQILGSTVNLGLPTEIKADLLFQIYIFSLIIQAARDANGSISYEDVFGNTNSNFIFRSKPGYIYSNKHAYTHANIIFPNKEPLEVHMGVRVLGKSKVLHECDIAVIYKKEAISCRENKYHPSSSKIIVAVECKFYTKNLDLDLARSFMGLSLDLSVKVNNFFVTNSTSDSVNKLLQSSKRDWEHNIVPRNINDVDRLCNLFQKSFEGYKAL